MRPPSQPQSALRFPLNHILGTEANVRVLRVILMSEIPIGVSDLARLAELQPSGVARVCQRLEDLGVIEVVGRGARNQQYRAVERFALRPRLTDLFRQEREQAERVLQEVQSAVEAGAEGLRAGWIEGPVARGVDSVDDPIVVTLLVDPDAVERVRLQVWDRLLRVQANSDVVIELRVMTDADLETADRERLAALEHVRPLLGPPPLDLLGATSPTNAGIAAARHKRHEDLDARSKQIARIVAERIKSDPSLVEDAKRYVERRLRSAGGGERLELQEWRDILETMSVPKLRRFLTGDDPRITRLRQSLPFVGVLSDEERRDLFAKAGEGR